MIGAARRILVVDDEPEILKVLHRVLGREYHVVSTTDPLEAAEMLDREEWDVLISDIDMPSLNGYELVKLARRLCPTAVRILITGAGTMEGAIRAINEGEVHRYVPKPFTMTYIRDLLAEVVARKDELDQVAEATRRLEVRRRLGEQLESEHPGLTTFDRDEEGAYLVDPVATTRAAARLGLTPLLSQEDD
jgi:DNA-binding NtrC family response regulator